MSDPESIGGLPVEIIAHRGFSSRAPENTLASIDLAVAEGARAIEWDVRIAACGTPVLFHDPNLGRTTNGVGPLHRRTATQLAALDAGSWFGSQFAGEPVPPLRAALERASGRVEHVFVEIKGYRELEDIDRIVSIVEAERGSTAARVISLDWTILDRVLAIHPGYPVAFIAETIERVEAALERASTHGAGLSLDFRLALERPDLVRSARDAGVPVSVWTVNREEDAQRVVDLGIRWITSDDLSKMLSWAEGRTLPD
jgi:glycerophosphoryl diester phosphodiesterase